MRLEAFRGAEGELELRLHQCKGALLEASVCEQVCSVRPEMDEAELESLPI